MRSYRSPIFGRRIAPSVGGKGEDFRKETLHAPAGEWITAIDGLACPISEVNPHQDIYQLMIHCSGGSSIGSLGKESKRHRHAHQLKNSFDRDNFFRFEDTEFDLISGSSIMTESPSHPTGRGSGFWHFFFPSPANPTVDAPASDNMSLSTLGFARSASQGSHLQPPISQPTLPPVTLSLSPQQQRLLSLTPSAVAAASQRKLPAQNAPPQTGSIPWNFQAQPGDKLIGLYVWHANRTTAEDDVMGEATEEMPKSTRIVAIQAEFGWCSPAILLQSRLAAPRQQGLTTCLDPSLMQHEDVIGGQPQSPAGAGMEGSGGVDAVDGGGGEGGSEGGAGDEVRPPEESGGQDVVMGEEHQRRKRDRVGSRKEMRAMNVIEYWQDTWTHQSVEHQWVIMIMVISLPFLLWGGYSLYSKINKKPRPSSRRRGEGRN